MKVLQIMAGAQYGGAEAFFTRLVIALNKSGLEQRVIIRKDADRVQILRDGRIDPVEMPFGGKLDFITPLRVRRQIADFQPDIVLSWMNRATAMVPSSEKFIHLARLGGYYNLKYYRKCDQLIANTEDIYEYLTKNGWPMGKVHFMPNFVGAQRMAPIDRQEYFIPQTAPLILGLGRLHENKGFDVLLEALARVPNAYLWLAGEGPLRKELEKKANKLGVQPRVRFLGWRNDPEALFAAADIFVCPSRHEPLGNVVMEAWAQGVPVIAADSLGPGTLIQQGQTGILFPIDDSAALAKSINHLIEDDGLRERIAVGGYEAFEAEFTEANVVENYLKFFERLIA